VPHFEKMLYDNIQYVNLLNHFLQKEESEYLKKKLSQTINFINSEFKTETLLFGSAYDADSDGIEGKYYIWKFEELENILKEDKQAELTCEFCKNVYLISEEEINALLD